MKIAVFHNLPSGGAKRALHNAVRFLASSGHDISLTIPETADEEYMKLENLCHEIKRFPVFFNFKDVPAFFKSCSLLNPFLLASKSIRRLIALDRCQRKIAEFINSNDFDLVFSEQCGLSHSPFLFRYLEKPVVFFCQQPSRSHELVLQRLSRLRGAMDPGAEISIKPGHTHKELKLLEIEIENASHADLILCNSFFSREAILRRLGLNSSVCYLGIDTGQFTPLFKQRENFVLSVGSISPAKGFDFVISSVAEINSKIRPRVVLVGNASDGTEKHYLTNLARDKGVELEIKVMINDAELTDLYNRAKVFTYASYLEPFGLTPVEAMACGTPVVAVKEGGVRESVTENVTGFLVDRDEKEFSKAVETLLLNNELRKEMGDRGIEDVRNRWTLEEAGKRLLNCFNALLENN